MAYVYEKVGQYDRSSQTPDYSSISGDGDFVLKVPDQSSLATELEKDYIVEPAHEIADATTPTTDQTIAAVTFANINGYVDPDNSNFVRNDWSDRLGEFRGSKDRRNEFTKAFSWLSLMIDQYLVSQSWSI